MNSKENILNAWIMIEQLSEGSIDKNDKKLKNLDTTTNDWHMFFSEFLNTQKDQQNISDINFKKSGLVMYFDIFDFQDIVKILRRKYNIPATFEEITNSQKFTFSLYFDNQLNFLADKLFFTVSGYIKHKGEIPNDFLEEETTFRDELDRKFKETSFNSIISELFQQYNVSQGNFGYGFVNDLENGDVNLHSFFISDLQKAKKINSENMNRYFNGFSGVRINLDSKKDSPNFNPRVFESILQPKFYPLGRFPNNPDYALSFMQQVSVNLALNDINNIRSVNGPPGTGKTTLLKDIFADLIVQQAAFICELFPKNIPGSLVYWKNAKLGVLPRDISDKSIVVASSNNGAVQNIVNELPKMEGIAEEFQMKLAETNYFKDISNSKLSTNGFRSSQKVEIELIGEKNWGTFSLEGGASTNVNNLLLNIELIEKYLDDDYQSDPIVYEEFLCLYNKIIAEREKIQKYSEQIQLLSKLKTEYEQQSFYLVQEENKKQNELATLEYKIACELDKLQTENGKLQEDLLDISSNLEILNNSQIQAERNFEVILSQKPNVLWFYKIFRKNKVNRYFDKLNTANQVLNNLSEQKNELLHNQTNLKKLLKENSNKMGLNTQQIQSAKSDFDGWIIIQKNSLKDLEQKIAALEKFKSENDIIELDFSKSYNELQKSNPWFTREFRILQSDLFILALKVRKQFLKENKKHLSAARKIWGNKSTYISKENGQQLVKESWQWLNFAIPVVSTTFASFGRMFEMLTEDSIGNVFIDEAGQALPQASVGAIFRSKKVMVVGDPSQIKPVLTLDSNVLNLIGKKHQVDETFVSAEASTQTLVDETSQYGFQKNDSEWIGIPLWVHRRSDYPMFTISNEISYDGLMVQGKPEDKAQGKSVWYDSTGKANDKFVKEQAELLKNLISERLKEKPELANEIYVISPFRNVAYKLAGVLDKINFTKREKGKPINIGTVHTFQGKEAKIVYFVLGADTETKGSANWAVSDPNMMNVAATRAKEEFYIIGDKNLYSSLGSKVANTTISIIDNYNK